MVWLTILRTRRTFIIPIKEDHYTGDSFLRAVSPLSTICESLNLINASCILWNNTCINIAALIVTPEMKQAHHSTHELNPYQLQYRLPSTLPTWESILLRSGHTCRCVPKRTVTLRTFWHGTLKQVSYITQDFTFRVQNDKTKSSMPFTTLAPEHIGHFSPFERLLHLFAIRGHKHPSTKLLDLNHR